MIIKTRIFELIDGKYENLSELAYVMGISVSQIYRVKEGKRNINQKFIIGAIKAFPDYNLDDLFYLAPESPTVTKSHRPGSAAHSVQEQAAKEKETEDRTLQVVERFTLTVAEHAQHLKSHISALSSLRQASEDGRRRDE